MKLLNHWKSNKQLRRAWEEKMKITFTCENCKKKFKDDRSFNAHECVAFFENNLTLEEMLALYEKRQSNRLN